MKTEQELMAMDKSTLCKMIMDMQNSQGSKSEKSERSEKHSM